MAKGSKSFWKREYKGLNVHGWIAISLMIAIAIYVVLARIFGWERSSESAIAFLATSTYLLMSQMARMGERLLGMEATLAEIRDLAKSNDARLLEIRDLAKSADAKLLEIRDLARSTDTRLLEIRDIARSNDARLAEIRDLAKSNEGRLTEIRDLLKEFLKRA